ncbi:MAG: sortase [Betaproteobacteria bacterium]|nr:sortase [Betaproteobacteria bacterium]
MLPSKTVGAACRPRWQTRFLRVAAALAFAVAVWQLGQGSYIQAKAWPWADTWPVARIVVPGRDIERFVLAGAEVVDKSDTRVLAQRLGESRLTLVTCYPFDALRADGPLRYVVTAKVI